jgi:hypothetical protein
VEPSERKEKMKACDDKKRGDRRALRNMQDLRLFVAHILREVQNNKMDVTKARTLFYGATVLQNLIRDNEIEQRITEIEKALAKGAEKGTYIQ